MIYERAFGAGGEGLDLMMAQRGKCNY